MENGASLKRLKRIREKNGKNAKVEAKKSISDDDKIQIQLLIDVNHFISKMESLEVDKSQVKKIDELEKVIQEATKTLL